MTPAAISRIKNKSMGQPSWLFNSIAITLTDNQQRRQAADAQTWSLDAGQRVGSRRSLTVAVAKKRMAAPRAPRRSESIHQPVPALTVNARAPQTDTHRPPINHHGQRRCPGHAKRMQNRKATRMKPPTILVAVDAPPMSAPNPPTA